MAEFDFSDAVNPFTQNNPSQEFDFSDAVNPFSATEFTKRLSTVDGVTQQPEWLINHREEQSKERSWGEVAHDTGSGVMKSLAGVANAAMQTGEFLEDAIPMGGLAWKEGDVLPSYQSPGEYQQKKEQGMATPTDATGSAMDHWEQGKSKAIKEDAEYVANADGFADTFKRVAERPRVIGNAIADSIGYVVPGLAAARAAKIAGATGKGIATTVAGAGAITEGGAARSQAVDEVMNMPLGDLLEHSPDYQQLIKSGVNPEAARMRVAADAGFTAQAITMPVSFLASALTGAAKAEADFFTGQGARDFFTGLFKQAGEEATQEMGSQFGVNVGVSESADNRRDYTEDLGNAAAMGVIMGPAQQAGMKAVDVASQQLGKVGAAPQDDGEIDLPQNGEEIGGGIVDELPEDKPVQLQIGHDPQRMIVLPDGTTAWESEAAEMFPPSAANQHPGFAKLTSDPDQIEGELTGDTDIDTELRALMVELDQAESIAREASPMAPPGVNPFDQFDQGKQRDQTVLEVNKPQDEAPPVALDLQASAAEENQDRVAQPVQSNNFLSDDKAAKYAKETGLPVENVHFTANMLNATGKDVDQFFAESKADKPRRTEAYERQRQELAKSVGDDLAQKFLETPGLQKPIRLSPSNKQSPQPQENQVNAVPVFQNDIDTVANEAATSPLNDLPEPTEAQREAGNYKKAHVKVHGLDIAIENPRGSTRSGTDKDGKPWSVTMHNHYGYIKRTEGADGDHVDVFIGPNPESDKVFIVDQVNADGSFDEHKILMGFDSKLKARSGYKSNYSSGWKVGPITSMNMAEFKEWVKSGDTTKPLSPTLSVNTNAASAAALGDKKRFNSESKSPISESKTQKSESELPPILTQSRKQFITAMAKERALKKDSPGYADALKKVEADYEQELDRAHANLSFDEFNRLNSDSPESVNLQAWESLREEYGTDDTRYSIGDSGGISVKSAQSVVDGIRKSWKNPHIKIATVANIDAMPEPVRARIQADQVPNEKVKAVFHNGSVYVNASTMRDAADVERAVFHEVHGHYGTRLLFGRETSTAMGRLYLAIGGAKGIRDIAKKHNIDLSKYEEILKGESPAKRAEVMADELLAHIAQDSKPSVKRWFQELIGAIRTWLRAHGFKGLGQFSDSEIMALLKRTREAATELKLEGGSVLRVLRDVAAPDATAKADTTQAAYSLSGLPPKTRKIIGSDPALAAWTLLAQSDDAFQLPVSDKKTLEDIFSEVAPGIKIRRAPEFDDDGAQVWAVNPKKDTLALVFQKGKSVWIDVADYSDGQGGRWIYNAVANYAHNTGKTFIGDPAGLSDKAMARRLENMISSALKFGTTEHLWPHERQEQGGAGVPPIKWKAGDDTHNLKEMIKASYEATLNQFPEIKDLRYNPITDQIEGVKDGKVYTRADVEKIAESKRAEAVTGEPPVTAGRATLERAVLTHSLLRGTRQEQFNVLAALSNQRSERLAGILYSLAPGNNQQTRPSGGFSVSGVMEKMGLGKDNRGASLPPSVRAAYDMLGGKDKTFAEKIKQKVKRQLAPGGLLPREIFDLKIARDAEMNSEDNQQRYILEDFYAQVVEVYHKPYTELRASTRKEIDDYLKGERTNVKLTDSMVKVLGRMRKHIQNLSAKYIDELLLDAASLEAKGKIAEADEKRRLINTITENFDTYLHRSYRAFDDPDWPKKVPEEVYQTAVDYLANQYAGNDSVNESHIREATKKVDLMLHEGTAHDSMARFIAESKLGSKDLSVLKKRKAIAPEIRALLGEYEDPAINYAKSVTKMTRLVSNTAFLRQMRKASLSLGLLYEEKDRPVGAHKKIAADASEVYSPLNGLYTYPEFEQALRDAVGSNKEPDWYKWIVTANAAVKYGKTVLAPTTAMRNIISASMFSLTSGHWNLAHLDKSLKAVKTYFTAQDVRGSREYINKLLKLGVLYDAPNYRELQDLIKQVNEGESVVAKAMRKSKAATVLNYAQEFYALGDDFWKILGFENEKAMLIKHFNMSEANAEREAAERIRNTYPTYSMTGRGIQTLRRFPLIGSFPSFPAEIIRTTYHKFRYFHQDAKALGYSNPAVLAKGVGLALGAGMMGAISALSAAMFGVDDDEEEAIRQMLPEWSRNANLLFLGRDDKGQIEYMDLTWLDPYSYWKKPLSALARDKDIDEKAGDAAWEALSPFIGVDIAFGAAIQFAKDIANSGVTRETATDKLGKSLAPGAVNNAIGFWNAAHDTVTKSGKKYSFEDEALALFGFRKGTLNAKVGLTYQAYGYQDKKREASTVLRDKATNLGKVDINELRDAYAQSMEMHKEAWDEMRRIIKLAQKVGMSKTEVVAALRTSGISLRDARLMAADEEFRYQPPKNMMKLAIKRASILFDKETQDELKARAKSLRELQNEFQAKPGRQ